MDKHDKYREYLRIHRNNVQLVFDYFLEKHPEFSYLQDRIRNHDSTKNDEEEFDAYAEHWHGDASEEGKYLFASARHQRKNDHHWKHWDGKKMSADALVEMMCDWTAMALQEGDSPRNWVNEHREELQEGMHQESFDAMVKLLKPFSKIYYRIKMSEPKERYSCDTR